MNKLLIAILLLVMGVTMFVSYHDPRGFGNIPHHAYPMSK